jgi:hypothetical protein
MLRDCKSADRQGSTGGGATNSLEEKIDDMSNIAKILFGDNVLKKKWL